MSQSQKGKRKKWPAADKLRIVTAAMQPNVEVSELCRREAINPKQSYGGKLPSATKVFDEQASKRSASDKKKASDEGCDRGDYGAEPGAKKWALGARGRSPAAELQTRVHDAAQAVIANLSGSPLKRGRRRNKSHATSSKCGSGTI
jgi:hypothetical protein